jgi:hypothetical protein
MADARQRWFDGGKAKREAGASVVLTLDEKIQYFAERELSQPLPRPTPWPERCGDESNTGEVLAWNWPNSIRTRQRTFRANGMNRAVSIASEPVRHSLVTLAAAFDQELHARKKCSIARTARCVGHASRSQAIRFADGQRFWRSQRVGASRLHCGWERLSFTNTFVRRLWHHDRRRRRTEQRNATALRIGEDSTASISMGQEVGSTDSAGQRGFRDRQRRVVVPAAHRCGLWRGEQSLVTPEGGRWRQRN